MKESSSYELPPGSSCCCRLVFESSSYFVLNIGFGLKTSPYLYLNQDWSKHGQQSNERKKQHIILNALKRYLHWGRWGCETDYCADVNHNEFRETFVLNPGLFVLISVWRRRAIKKTHELSDSTMASVSAGSGRRPLLFLQHRGEADGEEQWPRRALAEGGSDWHKPVKSWRMPGAQPAGTKDPSPPPPRVPWCPGAERTTPSKTASALERAPERRSLRKRGPLVGPPPLYPDSTNEEIQRGRPHPRSEKQRHGDGEHLRAERLWPRQEEEEPRPDGSD